MRRTVLLGILLLLLSACAGTGTPPSPTAPPTSPPLPTLPPRTATPTAPPTERPVWTEAPLSGLPANPPISLWPPLALVLPSDSEQYGMSQASVVYEVATEGGVPRFLAIFEQLQAAKLGPVRSARPYLVEWACPYGALFVHWGGSPQALAALAQSDCLYNLEGMVYEGAYFWREPDPRVPWNSLFTRSDYLYGYLEAWGLYRFVNYSGYPHKDDAPLESRPPTQTISIAHAFSYPVRYVYHTQDNTYLREYQGRPHLDLLTGEQLRVKNVVVIFVPQEPIPGDEAGRLRIETVGEGEALIFQDGRAVRGRWTRENLQAELRFYDPQGREIAFNRGNIWIEVLAPGQTVETLP